MTKKDFERLLRNKNKLQELKNKFEDLAYKSAVGSQQITGMPFVSGTSDKVGDYATEITELEDKYISLKLIQDKLMRNPRRDNIIYLISKIH